MLFGGILGFVEDDEGVVKGSASHEGQGDDFHDIDGHEALDLFEVHDIVKGIQKWAEVGVDFGLHITGEEAQSFAGFDSGADEDEFADAA